MYDKHLLQKSLEDFVQEVAQPKQATPGAGSSAAVVAAMAASLVELIGQIAVKEGYRERFAQELAAEAKKMRQDLLELVEADTEALKNMIKANADEIPPEALYIPQLIAVLSMNVCRLAAEASQFETKACAGDATVAGYLAQSAVFAVAEIVRQNCVKSRDFGLQNRLLEQAAAWEEETGRILSSYVVLH